MTIIGDKGFFSKSNIAELDKRKLKYIIAPQAQHFGD